MSQENSRRRGLCSTVAEWAGNGNGNGSCAPQAAEVVHFYTPHSSSATTKECLVLSCQLLEAKGLQHARIAQTNRR